MKRTIYNAAEMTWAHAPDDIAAKTAISDHHPDARGRPRFGSSARTEVQRLVVLATTEAGQPWPAWVN
ncbi:hypothetical protein, partial [Candidatus Amarobacter glycogenicus]|uniref:hypothetical protein n=1 Tax=Candidatus Amarobacter glycogenicus TaxID=3140699 RepID=UPI0031CCB0CC